MFDAKRLLDLLVDGGAQQNQAGPGGGLSDLLRQLGQPGSQNTGAATPGSEPAGGLADILRDLTKGSGSDASGGGLGDIWGKLQQQIGTGSPGPAAPGGSPSGGGIADILGQVLSQATQGTREGAGRIGEAAGLQDIIKQISGGRSPDELLTQLKDLIGRNEMATGATLGGLGALVLGTETGRSLAVGAAKIGALALIGGLAYKAYQNYQSGRPPLGGMAADAAQAPAGSGFEPQAVSNETAELLVRAMIAAAAADGRFDDAERAKILGALQQAGIEADAAAFLKREIDSPATVAELAAAVRTPEDAAQLYTAARFAIEPDSSDEKTFLGRLAASLKLDPALVAHLDASAGRSA